MHMVAGFFDQKLMQQIERLSVEFVIGDKLYQQEGRYFLKMLETDLGPEDFESLGARRQMLHAWRLVVRHPDTGKALELEAPLPDDFLNKKGGGARY